MSLIPVPEESGRGGFGLLLFAAVVFLLVPQWLAGALLGAIGASATLTSGLFHVTTGALTLTTIAVYLTLIARWDDVRRVFEHNGAAMKVLSAADFDARPMTEAVGAQPSFHPRSNGCVYTNAIVFGVLTLTVLGALFSLPEVWPGPHAWLLSGKVVLAPVAVAAGHEAARLVTRLYDRPKLRKPIRWLFALHASVVREPDPAQVEVALIAYEELLRRDPEAAHRLRV